MVKQPVYLFVYPIRVDNNGGWVFVFSETPGSNTVPNTGQIEYIDANLKISRSI